MTSRVQKRKTANTSVRPVVEAFTAGKNNKMRVLAAWSAILKDAAPWKVPLRDHTSSHLQLVRCLNNMIVVAADPSNAMV